MRAVLKNGAVFAALCVLSACGGGSSTDVQPANVADICAIYHDNPHWKDVAEDASRKWNAPEEVKMAIIWRESSFRARARPPGRVTTAYGYSQALDGTWGWYQEDTGADGAERDEFSDAIDFVGWYLDKTRQMNGVPTYDAFNQYLAYHEGHTGYRSGRWRAKPGVLRAAADVARQAEIYRRQLDRCS